VDVTFLPFSRAESDRLVEFLTGSDWPFHVRGRLSRADVEQWIDDGAFDGDGTRTFWIGVGDDRLGTVRIDDLDDDTPVFDIRLREDARGRGLGTRAVTWLAGHVFAEYPDVRRIEATTRQDNVVMRRTLLRCGFVKEAHYREGWPAPDGRTYDSVGYALLRRDWENGTVTPVHWDDEQPAGTGHREPVEGRDGADRRSRTRHG
jgi:RimJ/RimL family protein N-acetyltransferase